MNNRITAEEYQRRLAHNRKRAAGKNNVRLTIDGITFDSKKEAMRWIQLKEMERVGQISNLRRQVPIVLMGAQGPIKTKTGKDMTYWADFVYEENDEEAVEDVKGYPSDIYLLKKAILAAQGITIREV